MEKSKYFKSKYKELYNEVFNYLVSKLEVDKIYDMSDDDIYVSILGYPENAVIIDLVLTYKKLKPVIQINTDFGIIDVSEYYTFLAFEDLIGLTKYIEKL